MDRQESPSPAIDDFAATAEWYLTVRCTNHTCAGLIAFQKTRFHEDSPDLRLVVSAELSVDCPHCRTPVRFRRERIERRNVLLTH